ncbi:MAG: uridine kinase [Candidatus Margulisiibacteriota bacterium]|nr:MAG: uridine kinase [Candidatus Margulisiibacteriota bacterium]
MNNQRNLSCFIGVYGGSGSGKSLFAQELLKSLGSGEAIILTADAYYKDQSQLSSEEAESHNFDQPDAIDFELLIQHIKDLRNGLTIAQPVYDFKTHSRTKKSITVRPQKYIIIEGLLFLLNRRLRDELDLKIYIDADDDVRLIRRIRRDKQERGQSTDSVINQYMATVRSMHNKHISPTKRYADIVIDFNVSNQQALRNTVKQIKLYYTTQELGSRGGIVPSIRLFFIRSFTVFRGVYRDTLKNIVSRYVLLLIIAFHSTLVLLRESHEVWLVDGPWPQFVRNYLASYQFPFVYITLFFVAVYLIKRTLFDIKQVNSIIRRYVYLELGIYTFIIISIYLYWTFYYGYF